MSQPSVVECVLFMSSPRYWGDIHLAEFPVLPYFDFFAFVLALDLGTYTGAWSMTAMPWSGFKSTMQSWYMVKTPYFEHLLGRHYASAPASVLLFTVFAFFVILGEHFLADAIQAPLPQFAYFHRYSPLVYTLVIFAHTGSVILLYLVNENLCWATVYVWLTKHIYSIALIGPIH